MNILVFSWRDPKHPFAGGAEQVMHEHLKSWVTGGHKVTLFASSIKKLPTQENIDGIEIIRSGNQYLEVQLRGFLFYLKNSQKFDLIVDQFHGIPFFTPLYSNKPKLAVIQETAREVWFLNPFSFPINLIVGTIGFFLEPFIFFLYKNTQFMTGSKTAMEDIKDFGIPKANITIVPHGILKAKISSDITKEKKPTLIYLSVISKDKGIEDVIEAFLLISKRVKSCQLWIVGKAETKKYLEKIKAKVAKNKLRANIHFFGYVEIKKKFELLKRANILLNASVKEGWGLVNIEANSVGTPVIAYKSGGLTDSVKDGYSGLITTKNSPKELASLGVDLLNNPIKYQKLSKSAVAWSQQFSWEKSTKLSLKLINQLIK